MHNRYLPAVFVLALVAPSFSWAAPAIDKASVECMECHEEVEGTFQHTGDTGHAVGVDYSLAASRNPGLVKPANIDPAIRLADNNISCVTCHKPYDEATHESLAAERASSAVDPLLSVDNSKSGLCTACHAK
ncbi:MAG: hypothetical protein HYV24_03545 [Deltaproteobacteria bacterium]|nr:hypothetical protein [Deltaproteobacteria bacterium]